MAPSAGTTTQTQTQTQTTTATATAAATASPFDEGTLSLKEGELSIKNDSGPPSSNNTADYIKPEELRIAINGKWLTLSKDFVAKHPGGHVINQYRNSDATHIFHAFHEGSQPAYKQLTALESMQASSALPASDAYRHHATTSDDSSEPNLGAYNFSVEQEMKIVTNFERLRQRVHAEGLMAERPFFYARKVAEAALLLAAALYLQWRGWYLVSATVLALCWQQLGWLTHEFCHHQPFKRRCWNDAAALLLGNVAQGFSRDWWKDKHNVHHAATNIVEQDGDIDLAPLVALVPSDLRKYREPLERLALRVIPYQHLYFTLVLPLLRLSWTSQSVRHVFIAPHSEYRRDRAHATAERVGIALHWTWVLAQLYFLPNMSIRLTYFAISQLLGGLFIALVVTYNHNSVDKFPENSRILNNFAALHILTTRNMRPSPFVDWFWGGLNYQIEHHLFPTMPRPNLTRCSALVKAFCAENSLPYLVDDYCTGYAHSLRLLRNVADIQRAELEAERKKLM